MAAAELRRRAAGQPPGLRAYPIDSPRAKARLVVLALLADGRLTPDEVEGLERGGVFERLGVERADFFAVLTDFCSDLARLGGGDESANEGALSPEVLALALDEVRGPAARRDMLRLIFDAIRSDGRLHAGEARLFWGAVDAWQMPPGDPFAAPRRRREVVCRPEHYYG